MKFLLESYYSKRAALVLPRRATLVIGIQRVTKDEKGNKSHTSITFVRHSLKGNAPFRPAGSLRNTAIVTLSDGCSLQIAVIAVTEMVE